MTILRVLPLFILSVFLSSHISAQEEVCYEKGGMWDTTEQRCAIRISFELDIAYPVELANEAIVSETLDTFVLEQKAAFFQLLAIGSEGMPSAVSQWFMRMDYEITNFSDDIVSVIYTISECTGGAHPNSYFRTFTFNLATDTVIEFEDLFAEDVDVFEVLTPLIESDLTAQIGDFADATWIEDGTGDNPENYRNFALTEDEIVFLFPPYQVAAYAAGAFEVRILLVELASILDSRFSSN